MEPTPAPFADPANEPLWKRTNWWGVFLLVLGLWWLLGETGRVPFEWSWAGPLALVVVGIHMLTGRRKNAGCEPG